MKKILTSLALLGALVTSSFAQRSVHLDVIRTTSSDTVVIDSVNQVSFITQFAVINTGPDSLIATDSLMGVSPYSSWYYIFDTTFPVGDTIAFIPDTLNFATGPETGDFDFCDSVWAVSTSATDIITDPSPAPTCFNVYIWNRNGVGIDNLSSLTKTSLDIFPNPATSTVNIKYSFSATTPAAIRVTDITGRVVLNQDLGKQTPGAQQFSVDVSALNNGIYTIELITDQQRAISKLTISK